MRAFVGVQIGPEVAEKIVGVQAELKRTLSGVRWVVRENLHFTLKFLGEVAAEKIDSIASVLADTLRPVPRFRIISRGIGVFPDVRRARVLWVGLESRELEALAVKVESLLEPMGFPRESRAFRPHLTLGRWRDFCSKPEVLRQEIERWKDFFFGECPVEEVILFQSTLKREGAVYTPLHRVPLSGG